jgi:hypothetical protein
MAALVSSCLGRNGVLPSSHKAGERRRRRFNGGEIGVEVGAETENGATVHIERTSQSSFYLAIPLYG